jgi:hypothetical protein
MDKMMITSKMLSKDMKRPINDSFRLKRLFRLFVYTLRFLSADADEKVEQMK